MIRLENLSDNEIERISHYVTDSFYDYKYNNEDEGLKKFISTRENMFVYMNAIVRAAYKCGLLYTTSENHEGFLFLAGSGFGSISFCEGIKMILAEKRAIGGWKKMSCFIKACFSEGGSIETRMKKSKRKFLKIEMLVVRPEYQKKRFMRQMMNYAYKIASQKRVAVILDTDDKDKCLRYEHLGMKLERVRNCGEKFKMYDLIRDA